jgi:hypothetical protein
MMGLHDTYKIGYLGRELHHGENLAALLASAGQDVTLCADSMSAGACAMPATTFVAPGLRSVLQRSRRVVWQLRGTGDRDYLRNLLRSLDRHRVDCLLAYWGTGVLGDIIAVKRHRPAIRVVLNLLCHPTALTRWRAAAQDWHLRRSLGYLDGLIAPSCAMQAYLERHILRGRRIPCLVWPPYLSQRYYPGTRLPANPQVPNVLYLGRMDIARAQITDNVLAILQQLLDCGIHVHHCHVPGGYPKHPLRHVFTYTDSLAEAINNATSCDVSLVMYNLAACPHRARFEMAVPDRLVASVAAGIPIAIPREGYAACKEYLRDYPAVIEFGSIAELAQRLRDRPTIAAYQRAAREASRGYVGEHHLPPLLDFLGHVVERPPAATIVDRAPSSGVAAI